MHIRFCLCLTLMCVQKAYSWTGPLRPVGKSLDEHVTFQRAIKGFFLKLDLFLSTFIIDC